MVDERFEGTFQRWVNTRTTLFCSIDELFLPCILNRLALNLHKT
jgi:hypothetical protein